MLYLCLMLTKEQRIDAFAELGLIMAEAASDSPSSARATSLREIMDSQEHNNKWFTPDNVRRAAEAIASMLRKDRLKAWLDPYNISGTPSMKVVAVVMAGNIPLVGFHDLLCVVMSGNIILAKTSTKDSDLIPAVADILISLNGDFREYIRFAEKINSHYDAVIATGSDNTARYFDYYFGHKPHIFRKNRNSIAIIDRNTKEKDLKALGTDIFSYFGLGCRNVSKLYIEKGLDPLMITDNWSEWSPVIKHIPYSNNYLHNKSLFHINRQDFHDNGFSLLLNNNSLSSPVSVIYYEHFSNIINLQEELRQKTENIQCIVSENNTPFGQTQYPRADEYPDNVDTMKFLISLQ